MSRIRSRRKRKKIAVKNNWDKAVSIFVEKITKWEINKKEAERVNDTLALKK